MRVEQTLSEIRDFFVTFTREIDVAIASGQTDLSAESEAFLAELFREIFDLPALRNLNTERANFPGLDLGDEDRGVGFQITADRTLAKVLETVTKVVGADLQARFHRVYVYVTTRKQGSYKQESIDQATAGKLHFNAEEQVLDFTDLIKRIGTFELDRLERVAAILRKHLTRKLPTRADDAIVVALERDWSRRYRETLQRAQFPEHSADDLFRALAEELLDTNPPISSALRRRVLLRASRNASVRRRIDDARRFLTAAESLAGPDSDVPARALIAEAEGDVDGAIRLLRDERDVDSDQVLFAILVRNKTDETALGWLQDRGLSPAALGYTGVIVLSQVYLRRGSIVELRDALDNLTAALLTDCPYLSFLRAAVRLAALFPPGYHDLVLRGIPLDVRFAKGVLAGAGIATRLDNVIEDLDRVSALIRDLDLPLAKKVAEAEALWARLLHPQRRDVAIERLKAAREAARGRSNRTPFSVAILTCLRSRVRPVPVQTVAHTS